MELRIATSRPLPEPDPDEDLLLDALARRGVRARMAAWDDPGEPWDAPVPTVVRSTWDYLHRPEEFLAWADRAARAAPFWNPPEIVRWNVHKAYLAELGRSGIPIVPTVFLGRGSAACLGEVLAGRGWDDVVIKPAVSAASFATVRARPGDPGPGEAHLASLLRERDVMVQPYVPAVESSGERSLVWIDGALTHAVRKSPRFGGGDESVSGALPIAPDEAALAHRVLARFQDRLLYARVDLVRDAGGRPMLMELELIEPSLFLLQCPEALDRLSAGIVARLRRTPG